MPRILSGHYACSWSRRVVIGHLPARFAASMTFGLASLELVITFEGCAARRTSVADLSTGCARQAMPRRAAEHEVPAHVTDLDAIKQHSDVIMCHERAPPLKAMVQGPDAKRMTCFAVLDAATHHLIARILHLFFPPIEDRRADRPRWAGFIGYCGVAPFQLEPRSTECAAGRARHVAPACRGPSRRPPHSSARRK